MICHYKHKERPYNTEIFKIAYAEIRDGASIRIVAAKYTIGHGKLKKEYMLVKKLEKVLNQPETSRGKKGRKTALEDKLERQILYCVKVLEKMGMPHCLTQFLNCVTYCTTSSKQNRLQCVLIISHQEGTGYAKSSSAIY